MPDGTILAGHNVTNDDILMLINIATMTSMGYPEDEILKFVNEYNEKLEGKTVIKKDRTLDYYTEFEEVTDKLMSEILIAEYEYAMYHDGDGNLQTIADLKNLWPLLLLEFYYNVKNNGPWDLKQHSEWQQSSLYYFNGELVDADAPGNIMFGYMGCAYGIPEMVLKLGAGAAQVLADTSSIAWGGTLFDDPMDAANISRGIELYKNIHS